MLRVVCIALLLCMSPSSAAQQQKAPTVLFPSRNDAPPPAAPVPFAERKPLKTNDTMTGFNGPSAAERCIAQCNDSARQCRADRPSEASCSSRAAPRGKRCNDVQNPAQCANCMAQVFDCTQPKRRHSLRTAQARLPARLHQLNPRTRMAATLYHTPSTAALVVHWLLIELDVAHVLHPLDFECGEQKAPAYLAINPAGVVPTLVLDGQVLTEAAAIVMHLADLYPHAGLAPPVATSERAAYYRWMFFCANTLQPAYRAWFYPHEPAGAAHGDAAQTQARNRIRSGLDPGRCASAGARAVSARADAIGRRFHADHVDALVAQHAASDRYLAGVEGACAAYEGASGVSGNLSPRGPDGLDLNPQPQTLKFRLHNLYRGRSTAFAT
ncbi:glutathione S-transferase [Xanthomonas bromi]|uniref:Glutathione S-transferase n=1 Tax=Xanthomonas bromi TaxID=56449 RepID=A0A1C3NMV6_9XANT|nr:glutathione S-transferase [Xanthomonas bromi]